MRDLLEDEPLTSATGTVPIALARRRPARLARRSSVEEIKVAIDRAVLARQRLRHRGATGRDVELNRLDIVCLQWELSHALIERHGGAGGGRPAVAAA